MSQNIDQWLDDLEAKARAVLVKNPKLQDFLTFGKAADPKSVLALVSLVRVAREKAHKDKKNEKAGPT